MAALAAAISLLRRSRHEGPRTGLGATVRGPFLSRPHGDHTSTPFNGVCDNYDGLVEQNRLGCDG